MLWPKRAYYCISESYGKYRGLYAAIACEVSY